MRLLAVYIGIVIAGVLVAYGIGLAVEHFSESASLIVFLGLFFAVLWGSWQLAVRLT